MNITMIETYFLVSAWKTRIVLRTLIVFMISAVFVSGEAIGANDEIGTDTGDNTNKGSLLLTMAVQSDQCPEDPKVNVKKACIKLDFYTVGERGLTHTMYYRGTSDTGNQKDKEGYNGKPQSNGFMKKLDGLFESYNVLNTSVKGKVKGKGKGSDWEAAWSIFKALKSDSADTLTDTLRLDKTKYKLDASPVCTDSGTSCNARILRIFDLAKMSKFVDSDKVQIENQATAFKDLQLKHDDLKLKHDNFILELKAALEASAQASEGLGSIVLAIDKYSPYVQLILIVFMFIGFMWFAVSRKKLFAYTKDEINSFNRSNTETIERRINFKTNILSQEIERVSGELKLVIPAALSKTLESLQSQTVKLETQIATIEDVASKAKITSQSLNELGLEFKNNIISHFEEKFKKVSGGLIQISEGNTSVKEKFTDFSAELKQQFNAADKNLGAISKNVSTEMTTIIENVDQALRGTEEKVMQTLKDSQAGITTTVDGQIVTSREAFITHFKSLMNTVDAFSKQIGLLETQSNESTASNISLDDKLTQDGNYTREILDQVQGLLNEQKKWQTFLEISPTNKLAQLTKVSLEETEKSGANVLNLRYGQYVKTIGQIYQNLGDREDDFSQYCAFVLDKAYIDLLLPLRAIPDDLPAIFARDDRSSFIAIWGRAQEGNISLSAWMRIRFLLVHIVCPVSGNFSHPIFELKNAVSQIVDLIEEGAHNLGVDIHDICQDWVSADDDFSTTIKDSPVLLTLIIDNPRFSPYLSNLLESKLDDAIIDVEVWGYSKLEEMGPVVGKRSKVIRKSNLFPT